MLRNSCFMVQKQLQKRLTRCICPESVARCSSSKADIRNRDPDDIPNEPLQYFGSKAAAWRARETRSGGADESLWYQPYVISASLAAFLLYFCVLREESDIDMKLEGTLYEHVSGLEEMQLAVAYKYNKEKGLDTKDLEERLSQLGVDVKELETQRLAEK